MPKPVGGAAMPIRPAMAMPQAQAGSSNVRSQGAGPATTVDPAAKAPGVKGPDAKGADGKPLDPKEVMGQAMKGAVEELTDAIKQLLEKLKGPEGAQQGQGADGAQQGQGNTQADKPCTNCGAQSGDGQGSCGDSQCPGGTCGSGSKPSSSSLGSPSAGGGSSGGGSPSVGGASGGSGGSNNRGPSAGQGSQGSQGGLGLGPLPPNPVSPTSELTKFPGVNDPRLQDSLNKLAQDPEGKNLLEEAKRRGVDITTGPQKKGELAHFDPNSNKISIGQDTLNRGTGLNSLVHELVHATTPENNSRHEEGMANAIAERISSRVQSRPQRDLNSVYNNTIPLYQNYNMPDKAAGFDNHINNVLRGQRQPALQVKA